MNTEFWKNKTVLITGHTGFKGSWLSLWLQERGVHLVGYALPPPTTPSFFEIGEISQKMISLNGDVRDLEQIISVLKKYEPQIVIHMAAQPIVRYSYRHPHETYDTNVMGTVNVLEAVRQTKSARTVLIITSDKCYQNKEWAWGYRETEPMGGHDPYSSSKACAELITAAYRQSFFGRENQSDDEVFLASARAGNVIGGGDWGADRLIPDVIRAVMNNSDVVIRNPNAIRPWQFVLEPLNGYLSLIENLWEHGNQFADGWNFGPPDHDCKPVSWILNKLNMVWDGDIPWELDRLENPHEASFLKLDSSKARSLLRWSSKLDVAEAISWVAEWYQGYFDGLPMRELSCKQISQYEKLGMS
jgi:CDP-glucose 4,6-dehydratase